MNSIPPGRLLKTKKIKKMSDIDYGMWQDTMNNLGQAAAIVAQGKTNKKTREWNEKMYAQQRADAMQDWKTQNEYNHPSEQMARLRQAGLNPNLVYGKGADNTASAVRSSSTPSWNPQVPEHREMSLMSHYDVQMKQAQIDNLRVQNTVATQEAILKAASTANLGANTAKTQFDLTMAQDLKETSLEAAKENLRKLTTGIDIDLEKNEREAASNSSSLREAAERILNMRSQRANDSQQRDHIKQQIENLKTDNRLKELDEQLKKQGIQPTDNLFYRVLGRILNGEGENLKDIIKDEWWNPTYKKFTQPKGHKNNEYKKGGGGW